MKKKCIATVCLLCIACILSACGSIDDPNPSSETGSTFPASSEIVESIDDVTQIESTPANLAPQISSLPTQTKRGDAPPPKTSTAKTEDLENVDEEHFVRGYVFYDETVAEAYSFDYINRLYHPIQKNLGELLEKLLNQKVGVAASSKDQVGFLIITETGKYAYYYDKDTEDAAEKELVKLAVENNEGGTGSVQWLAYMSISNITSFRFQGETGGEYSLKGKKGEPTTFLDISTEDPQTLKSIAYHLKSLPVQGNPSIYPSDGGVNLVTYEGDLYIISMDFASGVSYQIFGNKDNLTIHCSDMKEGITYQCAEDTIKALRDFMAGLKGVTKN